MPLDTLARAPADTLNVNALLVLVAVGVAGAAALLVAVPIVIAHRRRHRRREGLAALAVLWALVATAAVTWAVNRDWSASVERERQIDAGDLDPREAGPNPAPPWSLFGGLAVAYAGIAVWAGVDTRS